MGLGLGKGRLKKVPELIFELFPVLKQMLGRRGGDLSGGQQQQLAIGRALVLAAVAADPRRADRRDSAQHRPRDRRHHPAPQSRGRRHRAAGRAEAAVCPPHRQRVPHPREGALRRSGRNRRADRRRGPQITSACDRGAAVRNRSARRGSRRAAPGGGRARGRPRRDRGRAPSGWPQRRDPRVRDEPAAPADARPITATRRGSTRRATAAAWSMATQCHSTSTSARAPRRSSRRRPRRRSIARVAARGRATDARIGAGALLVLAPDPVVCYRGVALPAVATVRRRCGRRTGARGLGHVGPPGRGRALGVRRVRRARPTFASAGTLVRARSRCCCARRTATSAARLGRFDVLALVVLAGGGVAGEAEAIVGRRDGAAAGRRAPLLLSAAALRRRRLRRADGGPVGRAGGRRDREAARVRARPSRRRSVVEKMVRRLRGVP